MSTPFIVVNEYTIEPGKTDEFLAGFRKIAETAQANEPDLLYFAEHISEDGTQGSTVQVHADAKNMERHMELVGDQIRDIVAYIDFQAVRMYGTPTDAVLQQLQALAGDRVTVKPLAMGFDRFGDRVQAVR